MKISLSSYDKLGFKRNHGLELELGIASGNGRASPIFEVQKLLAGSLCDTGGRTDEQGIHMSVGWQNQGCIQLAVVSRVGSADRSTCYFTR